MRAITMERLVELGGRVWEKGTMKRVYFNYDELATFYGIKHDGWKFTVDGEKVSNNTGYSLDGSLRNGKFWYDITTGEFASKYMSEAMTAKLAERITKAAEELAAETENGETVETATEEAAPADETAVAASVAAVTSHANTATAEAPAGAGIRTAVGPGLPPGVKVYTNRKPGYCRHCGKIVPAGRGHLYYIDPDEAYEDSGWIVEHKGSCPTK